jgi:transcriptional regulator with XRE-family HTH domain
MTFGETLRIIRKNRGLSQRHLGLKYGRLQGKEDGVAASVISQWESNSRVPSPDTIEIIAKALSANEEEHDQLLMSAGYMPKYGKLATHKDCIQLYPSDSVKTISAALRVTIDLSDEGKQQIIDFTKKIKEKHQKSEG